MKLIPPPRPWPRPLLALLSLSASLAVAQVPPPATATPTLAPGSDPNLAKIAQMESTYLSNLRKDHTPILQEYLRELETLRQQLVFRGRTPELPAVDLEIQEVRRRLTSTGIMSYRALQSPTAEPPVSVASIVTSNKPLILHASEASTHSGLWSVETGSLPLGIISWKQPALTAGIYQVVIVYACDKLEQDVPISLKVGSASITVTLPEQRSTGSRAEFRAYRLGELTLNESLPASTNNLLQLSAAGAAVDSGLWIKSISLSKARGRRASTLTEPGS